MTLPFTTSLRSSTHPLPPHPVFFFKYTLLLISNPLQINLAGIASCLMGGGLIDNLWKYLL